MVKRKHFMAEHVKESDQSQTVEILDSNRTILVCPLNSDAGESPVLTRCRSMDDVFKTFQPSANIAVSDDEGASKTTSIQFNAIKDFNPNAVIAQSPTLSRQKNEKLILAEFLKAVKSNATLRKAIDDPAKRDQILKGFKAALDALGGAPE